MEGRENLAKGWIDCFYGYHQLGPPETHWELEKYQRWTLEDYGRDVFEEGHVDYAVLQSTFLKYWYTEGFNTTERNRTVAEAFPGKVIVNGRWDPREGEEGLRQFEEDHKRDNYKGVKLYTAEWYGDSRGYKVTDPEAYRFLDKTQELGIKNVHLHKGPTIWPLDKDAFDVEDVDKAATDFPELNFIVEHAGVPRIEEFCLHGGAGAQRVRRPVRGDRCPHARPSEVLREGHGRAAVLGGRGPHRLRQRLRHLGAEVAGRGLYRLADARQRSVLRLPAAHHHRQEEDHGAERGEALRHRGSGRVSDARPTADEQRQPGRSCYRRTPRGRRRERAQRANKLQRRRDVLRDAVWAALGTVLDPELDEPITELEFVSSCTVHPTGSATVLLRLPTFFCAPNFSWLMVADALRRGLRGPGVARVDVDTGRPLRLRGDQPGRRGAVRIRRRFPGEARAELDELRRTFFRKAALAGQDLVARPLVDAGAGPSSWLPCGSGRYRRRRT